MFLNYISKLKGKILGIQYPILIKLYRIKKKKKSVPFFWVSASIPFNVMYLYN